MASYLSAAPADVRAWANGFTEAEKAEYGLSVGTRGNFSETVIHDFNKAHANLKGAPRMKYVKGGHEETRLVTFRKGNRPVTRRVNVKAARAHVGKTHTTGRLSQAEWQAAAEAGC